VSLIPISAGELPAFRRRLLSWFAKCKRDLPWRRTKDAYRIWLSEIMLQQTRVAAVIPYYEKFVAQFPDVKTLACAKTDHVLANWAGLGYYSRARNLQHAAKEMVVHHEGQFPRSYEAALSLPGIGRYTAAAVLSIAYGEPRAVLDGNVARVLARLGAIRGELRAPKTWRKLETAAQKLLARTASGDWNQAMMELGAMTCTPKSPQCGVCPLAKWCRARKLGLAEELPSSRRKPAAVDVTLSAAVLLDPHGRTLLVRQTNGEGALFSRLWQFPALETTRTNSRKAIARHLCEKFGLNGNLRFVLLSTARHTVTFRNIRLEPYLVRVSRLPRPKGARATSLENIRRLPISNATQKIVNAALASVGLEKREEPRVGSLLSIT
jgi:A/G-specific adenine glycosylase